MDYSTPIHRINISKEQLTSLCERTQRVLPEQSTPKAVQVLHDRANRKAVLEFVYPEYESYRRRFVAPGLALYMGNASHRLLGIEIQPQFNGSLPVALEEAVKLAAMVPPLKKAKKNVEHYDALKVLLDVLYPALNPLLAA